MTHRPVYPRASCASRKRQWWRSEWWSPPKLPEEATGRPGGCVPSAQTSRRWCRSCLWHCTGTSLDLSLCPGWWCAARCSCLCCWWRSVQTSCQYPVEGRERIWSTSGLLTCWTAKFVAHWQLMITEPQWQVTSFAFRDGLRSHVLPYGHPAANQRGTWAA